MLRALDFWNTHNLALDNIGHWKIGPLELWIKRYENEWRIYSKRSSNPSIKEINAKVPVLENIPPNLDAQRFGVRETSPELTFHPVLSDRAVVVRPEKPFHLPAKEEVSIFVNTSVWLKISYGPAKMPMATLPIYRPSDTWFGSSTTDGELCYSARSKAKIRFNDLEIYPYRAVTNIQLQNKSNTDLFLERIKVPIPALSLYLSEEQVYFTDSMIYCREPDAKHINITYNPPPKVAGKCVLIHRPHVRLEQNLVSKAISQLLG